MDWLARVAAQRPGATAVVVGERSLSFADIDRAADAVAGVVVGSGLTGSSVAFWGVRDASTVAAIWGIPRGGATAMPIDPRLPPAEAMRLTRGAGVTGLWALPEGGIDRLLSLEIRSPRVGWGPPHPEARYHVLTSGTEGVHKPVVITGGNVAAAVIGARQRLENGPDDAWLCVLPLFHVGGLSIPWRQAESGAALVLEESFDPIRTAALLGQVAFASLVPTMLRRVLDTGRAKGGRVLVGGGPIDPSLMRRAITTGITPLQTYGMTETTSQVCTVAPDEVEDSLGTAGRPIAGAEVRITAGGSVVDGGTEGHIEVRGPMVSPGYLGDPARADGAWLTTGDLGVLDAAGRLAVTGRADALIVTGGENVHPAMIERELRNHPGVVDARVFGVPDVEWGRKVVVEIVIEGTTIADVEEWARRRLTPAAVPREWRVVPGVPGKLDS